MEVQRVGPGGQSIIKIGTSGNCVVPHAGTWIEILCLIGTIAPDTVVPHAGTWIEIKIQ